MQYNTRILEALIRQDFSSFIHKAFTTITPGTNYIANWHIDLIAEYLEATQKNKITRLIINIPPRALKSISVSVAWPAWLLAKNPAYKIMVASYSSVLSIKHSLDCRFVMSSNWYNKLFPNTVLSTIHNQKSKFLTTKNGFRFATSVGGSSTGEGGDFLIIDDPHNPIQIHSKKMRLRVIEWFEQTFSTRLNNKKTGVIVLVMQRLHPDDLSSHLISSGGWSLLKIPALASADLSYHCLNSYYYKKGDLLCKERDTIEYLNNIEHEMGSKNYSAQFLQKPIIDNYSLLKLEDILFYDDLPKIFDSYIHSWDTAIKISEKSDYSVGTCWGIIGKRYYLVAMIRSKLIYTDLKQKVQNWSNKYKAKFVLIEDKSSGQSLIQDLKLSGYKNIKAIKVKTDKVTRFAAISDFFQSGSVLLPRYGLLNKLLVSELTTFPHSKHDDIVDSVSQFLTFIKEHIAVANFRIRSIE